MQWRKIKPGRGLRHFIWEVGIVILKLLMGESLAKMLFEQALEGDAEEPCGCLRAPPDRENSTCKGPGAEANSTSVW